MKYSERWDINECTFKKSEVILVEDKMIENLFRWLCNASQ